MAGGCRTADRGQDRAQPHRAPAPGAASGNFAAAGEWSIRALRTLAAVGDKERIAWTLLDRGAEAFYLDDDSAAAGHLHTARKLFAEVGFKEGLAWADDLARLDLRRGDLAAALDRLTASLRLHHELGDRWRVASVLESLARLAARLDAAVACADLLGMAAATRQAIGVPVPECERDLLDQTRAWLRDAAGEHAVRWDGPPSLTVAAGHVAKLGRRLGG